MAGASIRSDAGHATSGIDADALTLCTISTYNGDVFTRRQLFALVGSFLTGAGLKRSGVLRRGATGSLRIPDRYIYGSIEVTAGAMKGERGAFVAAFENEMKGLQKSMREEADRLSRV